MLVAMGKLVSHALSCRIPVRVRKSALNARLLSRLVLTGSPGYHDCVRDRAPVSRRASAASVD